jgi:hypothetical protein
MQAQLNTMLITKLDEFRTHVIPEVKKTSADKITDSFEKFKVEFMAELDKIVSENEASSSSDVSKAAKGKKPAKEKKAKKEKDENAPKKPCSSYILFCKDMRAEVKAKNATLSPTDISRALGELWHAVDDETKTKYATMAQVDKNRYTTEMEAYKAK